MTDIGEGFHPLYRARLHLLDGVAGPGVADEAATLDRRRAFEEPFGQVTLPDVDAEDRQIDGPNGPVGVRIYRRAGQQAHAPGLLWMHGGQFMYNDLEVPEADHFGRVMADRVGAVVVSVDYRLCDADTHFPVPQDDCYAAYRWLRANADELGVDPARIAVGGGSAGGTLAASVALRASADGVPAAQLLLAYPVLHPVLPPASDELRSALSRTPAAMRFSPEDSIAINEFVMGRPIDAATPDDFPGLASDASVFPPTYIETSEFDELRASGEAFAAQLAAAGVEVECVTARGVPHGHLNAVGSPMLADAYARFETQLASGVGRA